MNIPGNAAGIVFRGAYAYVTGWLTGLTVLDISQPASPSVIGLLPLPHFENEDVELCGDTLLISNDREREDFGAILFVVDIAQPTAPALTAALPLGWTGSGVRGAGHIANFVTRDCSMVWVDGGEKVEVVDLHDRSNPKSLGHFESEASKSKNLKATHDSTLDPDGTVWNVGGGGAAHYRLTTRSTESQADRIDVEGGRQPVAVERLHPP